ncbi:MAG: hypothetical protein COT39_03995 [Parcubacteria group bacterium CG08_land_8_20_14_0_20_48_21]|nr:MAG: hypothetical protein AUK21_02605 [Parcubacteria group bacterium CG2_30_48_51]PIS32559.1 MAG: hypothetical protein COT39_03995 [Parcubacteria group bacterium CG08_land_8_20_14_0_20_48_21]PIW79351.1 MAG: hypothetical protein COZ99_01490 [Parcubacteria group bacterium CG_4_8_14_3_um_filter_48_16]PIY77988.1 MAG: hypothetical protein COY83_02335 [Parcubacteria group bacterium CG_4_10_14_0_8_um_filter_48_154]PJC39901.1 MAG: hypothetical protein CO043_01855 [Parcubacteria group bacterium CG_4_
MLLTIIVFMLILTLLVFVHELGHYTTARKAGVKVDEFGFGLPPRICGWQRERQSGKMRFFWGKSPYELLPDAKNDETQIRNMGATIWSLNWIPVGGFVKIKGEGGEFAEDTDSFATKSTGWRAIILSAGVAMNVILCAVLLSIGFMFGIPTVLDGGEPEGARVREQSLQVTEFLSESPAKDAGMRLGDTLLAVNNTPLTSVETLQAALMAAGSGEATIRVQRGRKILDIPVEARSLDVLGGKSGIGVATAEVGLVAYPFFSAVWHGIRLTGTLFVDIILAFKDLLMNLFAARHVALDVAGPVGIAAITGQVVDLGFIYVLQFAAFLSLNLAIINYLPIPALDGGQVVLLLAERMRRKPFAAKTKNLINNTGFLALLALILVITVRDVVKLIPGFSSILQTIQRML